MVWVVWDKDLQLTNYIYRPWARADGGHASWHPKICEEDKRYGGGIWQELLQGRAEQVLLHPGPSPAARTCLFPVLLACRVCCAPCFALRSRYARIKQVLELCWGGASQASPGPCFLCLLREKGCPGQNGAPWGLCCLCLTQNDPALRVKATEPWEVLGFGEPSEGQG